MESLPGPIDPRRFVFIDETWAKTNMTRLLGWAPRGERLIDKVPHGQWKTATFLAALRSDRIEAPCLFDGPINGERFLAYVEQFLAPTLKPGDVVILDNLGSHKGKAVRKAIRDVGARLVFLPKYSPDLNPIEQVFAKFKSCCERPQREPMKLSPSLRRDSHPISPRRMRRIHPQHRICVNPKADRSSDGALLKRAPTRDPRPRRIALEKGPSRRIGRLLRARGRGRAGAAAEITVRLAVCDHRARQRGFDG